ncbi:hypothetical protein [Serratia fonticola]
MTYSIPLLTRLDDVSTALAPLPAHYMINKDAHMRDLYAALLAAVLIDAGRIDEAQHRLFSQLLRSMGTSCDQQVYFQQAAVLASASLLEVLNVLRDDKASLAAKVWLFDAILLLRVASPLTERTIQTLSTLASMLAIDNVERLSFWVQLLLDDSVLPAIADESIVALYLKSMPASDVPHDAITRPSALAGCLFDSSGPGISIDIHNSSPNRLWQQSQRHVNYIRPPKHDMFIIAELQEMTHRTERPVHVANAVALPTYLSMWKTFFTSLNGRSNHAL